MRPLGDIDLVLYGRGLLHFIECHHDHRRAVAFDQTRAPLEFFLTFLKRNRVHDSLPLHALKPRFDDIEVGAVDHDGELGDVGFGSDIVQKLSHCLRGIEHALVHIDVDNICAAFNLFAGNRQGIFVFLLPNQAGEFARAGDVGALADHDEIGFRSNRETLETAEVRETVRLRRHAGTAPTNGIGNGSNMLRGRTATAAD